MENELGRFNADDFPEWADGRFENYFQEVGGRIYTDPTEKDLRKILRFSAVHGSRIYGTPSGKLTAEEARYDHKSLAARHRTWEKIDFWKKVRQISWIGRILFEGRYERAVGAAWNHMFETSTGSAVEADWGPANSFGLKGMCGGVSAWVETDGKPGPDLSSARGGSFKEFFSPALRTAYRSWTEKREVDDVGIRFAISDKI